MPAENAGAGPARPAAPDGAPLERRQNVLFRTLIDEMLAQVRDLRAHSGAWPAAERARAEEDLERIMGQVRAEAVRDRD